MEMKEEWLMPGAVVPVDAETTAALVAEIKRLIWVVGGMALKMQPEREWVGLTDEERHGIREWQRIQEELGPVWAPMMLYLYEAIEAKLKEKNA